LGFAPDPTAGAHSNLPAPLAGKETGGKEGGEGKGGVKEGVKGKGGEVASF